MDKSQTGYQTEERKWIESCKKHANLALNSALMEYGLSGDICQIIISYLPFQSKWIYFDAVCSDGRYSITRFILICLNNALHYIISFGFYSSNLLVFISFIMLSLIESIFILHFYKYKYNGFVDECQ